MLLKKEYCIFYVFLVFFIFYVFLVFFIFYVFLVFFPNKYSQWSKDYVKFPHVENLGTLSPKIWLITENRCVARFCRA